VGYSAAVRGPACQGGTADACPVRMGPGGPAPAGVYLANPPRLCVKNLKMSSLNLQGVQNDVDNWIRKKINDSLIVHDICSS
jgi:hypothetical protein